MYFVLHIEKNWIKNIWNQFVRDWNNKETIFLSIFKIRALYICISDRKFWRSYLIFRYSSCSFIFFLIQIYGSAWFKTFFIYFLHWDGSKILCSCTPMSLKKVWSERGGKKYPFPFFRMIAFILVFFSCTLFRSWWMLWHFCSIISDCFFASSKPFPIYSTKVKSSLSPFIYF